MGRLDWRTLGAELTTTDLIEQLAFDALEAESGGPEDAEENADLHAVAERGLAAMRARLR